MDEEIDSDIAEDVEMEEIPQTKKQSQAVLNDPFFANADADEQIETVEEKRLKMTK